MEFSVLVVATAMVNTAVMAWKYLINKVYREALGLAVVVLIGVGIAFLVRASDFGANFEVGGHALGGLNAASTVLVGYALASAAVLTHKVVKAVDSAQSAVEPKVVPPEA